MFVIMFYTKVRVQTWYIIKLEIDYTDNRLKTFIVLAKLNIGKDKPILYDVL